MVEDILRYEQVEISYSGRVVVQDVSFGVRPGEILGIVGESGSGKSSLIKAAMGLLGKGGLVTKGDIWYNGKDIPDLPERELQKIRGREMGMVFQHSSTAFCPIRKVGVQLWETVRAHEGMEQAEMQEKARNLLTTFGFSDPDRVLESYPFQLSGGMQQRVGIVAAMLLEPRILFADEPTSALDVTSQKQVVEQMQMVSREYGTTILIVTHNIGVVRAMADRILVLKDGCQVEYGEADQVLAHPAHPYTRRLLAAAPILRR